MVDECRAVCVGAVGPVQRGGGQGQRLRGRDPQAGHKDTWLVFSTPVLVFSTPVIRTHV